MLFFVPPTPTPFYFFFFFFNDTATTEIYTLSLHDALPICTIAGVVLTKKTARERCGVGSLMKLWWHRMGGGSTYMRWESAKRDGSVERMMTGLIGLLKGDHNAKEHSRPKHTGNRRTGSSTTARLGQRGQ